MDYLKKDIKTIKISLLIITAVVILFVLRLFSFVFIPFFMALFIAILLLPVLNWFESKKIPHWLGILIIVVISLLFIWLNVLIMRTTTVELLHSKDEILADANDKINPLLIKIQHFLGVESVADAKQNTIDFKGLVEKNSGQFVSLISTFASRLFLTFFFLALFLTGAHMFEIFLNRVTNNDEDSIHVFREIKGSLNGFIKVKFITSILTGIGFGLVALFFGVKFALFWGLLTFLLNFVQLIGSFFITTVLLIFGFVEIQTTGSFLIFSTLLIGLQLSIGGILEPILLGKSFQINTITVLISIAVWGFIFGIAGLILAIPITVFLKLVLERIPATQSLAKLLSSVER
jgi:predicted PurR-regulated permease PerM